MVEEEELDDDIYQIHCNRNGRRNEDEHDHESCSENTEEYASGTNDYANFISHNDK